MEKVIKVNVGGIAFTLEEEAYRLTEEYLSKFREHYSDSANGREISDAIEERMAELFIDNGGRSRIVTKETVLKVFDIIGKPEEVFGEAEQPSEKPKEVKKRFYRNPSDKMIGGVFGGIGAYFHIDPVWLRVGFTALAILAAFTDSDWWNPFSIILVYTVLWICIPMARTTEQKCAMRGESLSYDDIEKNLENRREYEDRNRTGSIWSVIGKCLLIIPGILLLSIGLIGFIIVLLTLFGVAVAGLTVPLCIEHFLNLQIMSPFLSVMSEVMVVLVITLPFIWMLYGGICLLFNLKSPKWRPGLIMFILWLLSLIGLAIIGVKFTKDWWHHDKESTISLIEPSGETLVIEFEDVDRWNGKQVLVSGDRDEYNLIYVDLNAADSSSVILYPFVRLDRTEEDSCSVQVSSNLFTSTMSLKEMNEKKKLGFYRFHNDTLTLSPSIFGKGNKVTELGRKVTISIPEGMTVKVEKPIFHQFENEFEYSNMDISQKRLKEIESFTDSFNLDINFNDFEAD